MIVTAIQFKANLGKYLGLAVSQDIFATKNAILSSQTPKSFSFIYIVTAL